MALNAYGQYVPSGIHPGIPASPSGGTGSPEGVVEGSPFQVWYRTDTHTPYVKETGDGTTTGWVAVSSSGGGGSGSVTQGVGAPSTPPADPTQPAIYTNTTDGVVYSWKVSTQVWI